MLDLAIQSSLDPNVRAIRYVGTLDVLNINVHVGLLVVEREDGLYALDVADERPLRDLDEEGLYLLALADHGIRVQDIDGAALRAEPGASNRRKVWRQRHVVVPAVIKSSIFETLRACTEMQLDDLAEAIGIQEDFQAFAYSMVCADLLEIDLCTTALNGKSTVRIRRPRGSFSRVKSHE